MREEAEEPNWFSRWEEELPRPEELMPLSQTLITPNLASAFDIPTPNNPNPAPSTNPPPFNQLPNPTATTDFDSGDLNSSGGNNSGTGDEPARTLKRPRLVWTPQLHKRFVDAVAHLGIKNAVPKTIMQLMSVDGLTRENVASHLQKYRLYLKRMQGLNAAGGGSSGPMSAADAATDQLFATGPLPHHFLNRGVPPAAAAEAFVPFVPMVALQQQHQQMAAAAAAAAQQQFYQSRNMGQFGGNGANGGFENGYLNRGMQRLGPGFQRVGPAPYVEDLEERSADGGGGGGRKVLTLFPTGQD